MKTLLLTGATGFVGHALLEKFIDHYKIVCLIRPNSINLNRIEQYLDKITILYHDIKNPCLHLAKQIKDIDVILHAGANPSAADSLANPTSVVYDNVVGTLNLLELARLYNLHKFVYYSSGEVFGPISIGTDSKENDSYNSNSPYAASKAAGEELCVAYSNSYNIPVSIIHINNTFGPKSQTNRLPVIIINSLLKNKTINIHVGKDGTIGGRRWFHVADVAEHTNFILNNQTKLCEKWNSAGKKFVNNLELAKLFAAALNLNLNYKFIDIDRPGHDLCFSIDPGKLYNLGYNDPFTLEERIQQTSIWYQNNLSWLE
jgi:dTDP-glucose 4,6-dehydratase